MATSGRANSASGGTGSTFRGVGSTSRGTAPEACETTSERGGSGPEPVANATLARHRVRDGIQRLILSGQYQPGQRLVQQDLAGRFGVAQSVVRESLLELQFCGLVKAVDNLGMFVSGLDGQTLLAAFEIREMFEGLAARLCCERAGRSDLRELMELAQRNYEAGRESDLERMSRLDRQFHWRMIQLARNEILARLTESYHVLGMFVRANRDLAQVRDEHVEMVKAIEANRPDEAERLARRHVSAAREAVAAQVAQGNFVPHWVDEPDGGPLPPCPAWGSPSQERRKERKEKAP